MSADGTKSMSIIVTKGTLDWAYPPFILSTTAAALGLNLFEGALWGLFIENPDIPEELHDDYEALVEQASAAVEAIVLASRAFFRNVEAVGDHMHKVMFYEKEADKLSTKLKKAIFATDLPLSHKAHLRNFVVHIDNLANKSEDVADRLSIYTIKRTV